MLKLIGAALILGSAGCFGLAAIGGLQDRVRTLEGLREGLYFLEEELSFALTPLPKLLETLSRNRSDTAGRFFAAVLNGLQTDPEGGLRQSWREGVEGLRVLLEEDKQALLPLADTLGRYDGEVQRQSLRQVRKRLEELTGEARENSHRLGKVYAAVSVAGGLAAVILLM